MFRGKEKENRRPNYNKGKQCCPFVFERDHHVFKARESHVCDFPNRSLPSLDQSIKEANNKMTHSLCLEICNHTHLCSECFIFLSLPLTDLC